MKTKEKILKGINLGINN